MIFVLTTLGVKIDLSTIKTEKGSWAMRLYATQEVFAQLI